MQCGNFNVNVACRFFKYVCANNAFQTPYIEHDVFLPLLTASLSVSSLVASVQYRKLLGCVGSSKNNFFDGYESNRKVDTGPNLSHACAEQRLDTTSPVSAQHRKRAGLTQNEVIKDHYTQLLHGSSASSKISGL